MTSIPAIVIRRLGEVDYQATWQKMQAFTDGRTAQTPDELWLLQHPPVYTLGKNGKPEHVLDAADIPLIQSDRGGQVTYHGPGQLVVYTLVDLTRAGIGVRQMVSIIEQSLIELLAGYGIESVAKADAPGVYVNDAKIAALGLRVRRGRSFHGLALNIAMDLEPFERINPCGFEGLEVTQLSRFCKRVDIDAVAEKLAAILVSNIQRQVG